MKRSRFSEEQIIGILKEHEAGVSVADLCRKHGVSDASIYKWKAKVRWDGGLGGQAAEDAGGRESWIRKSAQDDKWSFCLKAAMMAANRRDHEQTTAPEP